MTRTSTLLSGPTQTTKRLMAIDNLQRSRDVATTPIGDRRLPASFLLIPSMFGSKLTRAEHSQDANGSVRQTDSDAAIARLSAVKLGYLRDPFIRFLVQRPHLQPSRPPLINIGTYVRSEAIDRLVYRWLDLSAVEGKKCQVVSMGAGSDTRFWRINVRGFRPYLLSHFPSCLRSRGNVGNAPM